jgi:mRNA-degrading endonuclease RelE of RelBE toxin-antitoxin system
MNKLDRHLRERVDTAIREKLCMDPYGFDSKKLEEPYKGKRRLRVGNFRIIYAICEECRQFNYVEIIGCKDCKEHGRRDIILFSCDIRPHAY